MRFVPHIVKRNPMLRFIWRLFRDPYFEPITQRIAATLPKWRRQTIVQIGVNDGERDDPVSALLRNRLRWRALLVEPLPEYFVRLVGNYGSSGRFMFEQCAVGIENGRRPFYHIDERARQSPHWRDYFDRIGSLSRADLIVNLGDRAEAMAPYIAETIVSVVTVAQLLERWHITRVDALVVDAEGYDWQIIQQVLDLGVRPQVVLFEHTHLSAADRDSALAAMSADYSVERFERDWLCVLR